MRRNREKVADRLVLILSLSMFTIGTRLSAQTGAQAWNFDHDTPGKSPSRFTSALTGQGVMGNWVVMSDSSAPSPPNVLAQMSADETRYHFPLAIAEGTNYKDLALSVQFKTISGTVDQGAGLVFRLIDSDNYYVVRANSLEDNFRLYHVIEGKRVQFAGADFKVTPQAWHELRVEVQGDEFRCYYDGQLRITAKDGTFPNAGKIGLWTKADSVTYFDDLTVRDLNNGATSLPSGKIGGTGY